MRGGPLRLLGGAVQLNGAVVDGRDQLAQRLDGVVDRIGDRAGNVFGHGRLHRQIAVRQARQFVEQRMMASWLRSFSRTRNSLVRRTLTAS
jgi:hypothetical protein